jgi:hypothetical protein
VVAFLSYGYFLSRPCHNEMRLSSKEARPLFLVHEADVQKGGRPIHEIKDECSKGMQSEPELVDYIFGAAPSPREIIQWHRVTCFQIVTLLRVAEQIVAALPRKAKNNDLVVKGEADESICGPGGALLCIHAVARPHDQRM